MTTKKKVKAEIIPEVVHIKVDTANELVYVSNTKDFKSKVGIPFRSVGEISKTVNTQLQIEIDALFEEKEKLEVEAYKKQDKIDELDSLFIQTDF